MAKAWAIAPQSFDDRNTGMRFEFVLDKEYPHGCVLKVYSQDRSKVLRVLFARTGGMIQSDVRPFPDVDARETQEKPDE
jgi:hypothetical protein